jgi:hypothetical protein
MNVEQRVFNSLFKEQKTELSRVELAVIDDIDSKTSKANSESLQGAKLAQQAIAAYESAASFYSQAEFIANKALPQAKDLGAKQLVKQLQSVLKGVGGRLKRANSTAAKIKSLI